IGTRFDASGESRGVAVAWTGRATPDHWSGGARDVDFFDVKGVAERVCEALRVAIRVEPAQQPFLVPGQSAGCLAGDGTAPPVLGFAGQIDPAIADARGLPRQDRIFVVELGLDALDRARIDGGDRTTALPRFPFVVRDLSIVVADALPAEIIRGTIQAAA